MLNDLLDSRHWTMGGTFVTNIGAERMPALREAVRRFGDSKIVLLEESQEPAPSDYGGCLHHLNRRGDLSDFWDVVDSVDKESNEPGKQPGTTNLNRDENNG